MPSSERKTTPLEKAPTLTIDTLHVEVVEGADTGVTFDADSDVVSLGSAPGNDLVLTDPSVSGYHVELVRGDRGVQVRDLGSTNGTRVKSTLIERGTVPLGTVLRLGRTSVRVGQGTPTEVGALAVDAVPGLVGSGPIMRRLLGQVERVAAAGVSALLSGESGTGKEVFARLTHTLSARARQPFVTVDCGVFNPNLIASELFGHERGAFTGAERQRPGAFERANGGTLFLDEVGELPLELQPQLLGVLERRRFLRLGGRDEISVDVHVLAATNRDLREEVNRGRFRLDLYYRLAGVVLRIPPLRERREDIPRLVEHFLRERGLDEPLEELVPKHVLASLLEHSWPGNVRELRNWVDATIALGEASELPPSGDAQTSALPPPAALPRAEELAPYREAREEVLQEFERAYVARLLGVTNGNVSEAARRARMDRTYLTRLIQKHNLK
ncbi:MAG: sigma 54-interacting transcriptional regulator [Polyangiaceae bacterium]